MRTNFTFIRRSFNFLLLGFFFSALANLCQVDTAYGQGAEISDFTVSNSESHLLLYLTVKDWFTEDMEAAVHNGIPITFSFSIGFYTKRSNWPDKTVIKHEFNHIIEYDSLKKEYLIHRD